MKTIALISGKGGSGKSTLAAHLLVAASKHGRCAGIDLDPQRSLFEWGERRATKDVPVVTGRVEDLARMLEKARDQKAHVVIIDTAGRQDSAAARVASHADVVLVPVRPGVYDLRAATGTAQMLRSARAADYFVINMAAAVGTRASEARRFLGQLGNTCPVQVGLRVDFADALVDGRTVFELAPKGKAAKEVLELYRWIMKLPSNHQTDKP
jgi:chromosome partitioning protein